MTTVSVDTQQGVKWPIPVEPYTMDEVETYATKDLNWQAFRRGLKGLSTEAKLQLLYQRITDAVRLHHEVAEVRRFKVQVDNYLQALKRGGFLDENYQIKK